MKTEKPDLDRRQFIGSVAALGAAPVPACALPAKGAARQATAQQPGATPQQPGPLVVAKAPDGPVLKAGLIGCGGRGRGAALNFLNAGPHLQIAALADVFADRVEAARRVLKERGQDIPESRCFVGFDAYQKLLDSDVDLVLNATPPHFR